MVKATEKRIWDWLDENGVAYRIRDGHVRIALGRDWLVYYYGTETFNMDRQKRLGTGLVALARVLGIDPPKFLKVKKTPVISSGGIPVVSTLTDETRYDHGADPDELVEDLIDEFDRVLSGNGHELIRQSVPAGELAGLKSRIRDVIRGVKK